MDGERRRPRVPAADDFVIGSRRRAGVDVEVDPAALAHVHQRGAAPDRVGARRLGRAVPAAALRAQPLVERRLLIRLARLGEHAVARLQRLLPLLVQPLADGFGAAGRPRRPAPLASVRSELLELLLLGGAFGARRARAHVLDARRVRVQPRARARCRCARLDTRARARAPPRAPDDARMGGAGALAIPLTTASPPLSRLYIASPSVSSD